MLQYSQSSLNELLNSDRHVDHDKHLQSQPTSEGAYTMLDLLHGFEVLSIYFMDLKF